MQLLIAASLWIAGLLGLAPPVFVQPPPPPPAHTLPTRVPAVAAPHHVHKTDTPTYNGTPCTTCIVGYGTVGGTGTYNGTPIPVNLPVHVRMPDGTCAWTGQAEATNDLLSPC